MKKLYTNPNLLYQVKNGMIVPLPTEPRVESIKIGSFSITHTNTPREFDRYGRTKRGSYRLEIKTRKRSWTYKRGE